MLLTGSLLAQSSVDYLVSHPGMRVLFQGDSITDGGRWKTNDPNHVFGQSYVFLVAAKYGYEHPEARLIFTNRGVSGDKVSNLAARWQTDAIALAPDLLSILVGVNDLDSHVSAADFESQYDALLALTVKALPNAKLVLGEPFGLPVGRFKEGWQQRKAELSLRQAIVARLAGKYHAALVRYQDAFTAALPNGPAEHWIWDGVHPTYAGHQLMAVEWIRTVNAFFASSR